VGSLFTAYRGVLEKIVGVIIVVFGLQISGLINLKFLLMEKKIHMQNKPLGYLGTILVGLSFGIGWTPCIGPILGSILGFAATIGNLGAGMLLLTLYSLGLGIPFLMSAVMVQSFFDYFKKVRRFIPIITMASGIFLVFVGVLIFTGYFVKLAVLFQSGINALFPWLSNLG
jgi:cytochrome c-type biogenesis protein